MTRQDLIKKLTEIQEKYQLFEDLKGVTNPHISRLYEKYPYKDINPEFRINFYVGKSFDYELTYNGFGDISIEEIDILIKELQRKKEILIELEPYKGLSLGE